MTPQLSVVIPTYQRCDIVVNTVRSFESQIDPPLFEVIVSVDGSNDGTRQALERLETSFPLTVEFHENRGLPFTRNAGAAEARGDVLLFMDDDMEPSPTFLAAHFGTHCAGADVVVGPMPLHPDSPSNLLSKGVGIWAEEYAKAVSEPGHRFRFTEIFGGHLSIGREALRSVGGYDPEMRSSEDHEFGYRCLQAGLDVRFSQEAAAFQTYIVDAASHLRAHRLAGEADVDFVRRHPDAAEELFSRHDDSRSARWAKAPTLRFPRLMAKLVAPIGRITGNRIDGGCQDAITARMFFAAKAVLYWVGVAEARDGAASRGSC